MVICQELRNTLLTVTKNHDDDILAKCISQCTIEETVAELMTRYILRRLETK